jgi:hypothetical protein
MPRKNDMDVENGVLNCVPPAGMTGGKAFSPPFGFRRAVRARSGSRFPFAPSAFTKTEK